MDHQKKKKGLVFCYRRKDGSLSDEGLVDEALQNGNELKIRQQLIDAGIIREIVLKKINKNRP